MIVAIDTSTSTTSLALGDGSGTRVEHQSENPQSHVEEIGVLFRSLLDRAGVEPAQIRTFVVGAGPGSFTGLRIGFGFAKGFAQGCAAEIVGMSSFYGYAGTAGEAALVIAVCDARRGELFFGTFRRSQQGMKVLTPVKLIARADLEPEVEQVRREAGQPGVVLIQPPGEEQIALPGIETRHPDRLAGGLLDVLQDEDAALAFRAATVREIAGIRPTYGRPFLARKIGKKELERVDIGQGID